MVAIYGVDAEQLSAKGIQTLQFKRVSQTARLQTSVHDQSKRTNPQAQVTWSRDPNCLFIYDSRSVLGRSQSVLTTSKNTKVYYT